MIGFNLPYHTGKEIEYIKDAISLEVLSGNGKYTKKCQYYFEEKYGFGKCFLTTSCTDALEMAALLLNISPGDEVIMPSFTFVSTANAFVLRGAKIVFVDSLPGHPNMDASLIEELISPKTKAIVVVHYAGIACQMAEIMELAARYNLFVVEDAAQAVDSFYIDKHGDKAPLGSLGHLAAFSFHETKNIISGEGGLLVVNDRSFEQRAEIIWEKGTNRSAFYRNEVDKYGWVDVGSSFLPSEITAAFLYAQLEGMAEIQKKRIQIWSWYWEELESFCKKNNILLPEIPDHATNNAHMFYLRFSDIEQRSAAILALKEKNIQAVFHYQSLHASKFYKSKHDGRELPFSDLNSDTLLRLPFYYDLRQVDVKSITSALRECNF